MATVALRGATYVTLTATATDATSAPPSSLVSYELLLVNSSGYVVFAHAADDLPSGQLSVEEM